MYHLIGEDMSLSIAIGTEAKPAGAAFPGGAGGDYTGLAKKVGTKSSIAKTNVKAAADPSVRNRYHSRESSLEIEGFVSDSGFSFFGTTGDSAVGYFVTVTYAPLSGVTNGFTKTGVVTDWSSDNSIGGETSEKITVDLNPDYTG